MSFALPAGGMDPGIVVGFAATACVWAMGMVLEWSGRHEARHAAIDTIAAAASLPWEDVPVDPTIEAEEPARAA